MGEGLRDLNPDPNYCEAARCLFRDPEPIFGGGMISGVVRIRLMCSFTLLWSNLQLKFQCRNGRIHSRIQRPNLDLILLHVTAQSRLCRPCSFSILKFAFRKYAEFHDQIAVAP